MGIIAITTTIIFVIGLFFLTLDVSIISKIYNKIEQHFFPKHKNDPRMRSFLLVLLIGNLTIFYVLILLIYKLFNC